MVLDYYFICPVRDLILVAKLLAKISSVPLGTEYFIVSISKYNGHQNQY